MERTIFAYDGYIVTEEKHRGYKTFKLKSLLEKEEILTSTYKKGKFIDIAGKEYEIPMDVQFIFIQFMFFLHDYDQDKIDNSIADCFDYSKFGIYDEKSRTYNLAYKGNNYTLIKFELVEVTT